MCSICLSQSESLVVTICIDDNKEFSTIVLLVNSIFDTMCGCILHFTQLYIL